jgi:hypothetical protein
MIAAIEVQGATIVASVVPLGVGRMPRHVNSTHVRGAKFLPDRVTVGDGR